jgi:hypothetical protein
VEKSYRIFYLFATLVFGVSLVIFVFFKAVHLSFTHDESFSYLNYCHESFLQIISFSNWFTNNHVLNSLLMKYSEKLFGNSEIALRLPNILSLIIYLMYGFLIFRDKSPALFISIFILLCTNSTLNDLFGLARGYGLSCGFLVMSLFHAISFFRTQKNIHIVMFHLAGMLAILSHFVLLIFYICSFITIFSITVIKIKLIERQKYFFFKINSWHLISFLFVVIILYEPVRRFITYSELDNGGKSGFFIDTVTGLINIIFMKAFSQWVLIVINVIFTLIILVPFTIIAGKIFQRDRVFFNDYTGLIILNFIIVAISLIIILQHKILDNDYPVGRFSIFLYPLFIIHLGFLFDFFLSFGYRNLIKVMVMFIAVSSAINFLKNNNLQSAEEWSYDTKTKAMINELNDYVHAGKFENEQVRLGIEWLFEPTVNFYRITKGYDWLLPADRNGFSKADDYCYIFKDDLASLNSEYVVIRQYNETNTVLLKNINH